MYYKRNFAVPNMLGGLIENVVNNNMNHFNDELKMSTVPVNILETDSNYELHVVAPGLKKEDFKLSIDKNILTISFEHKDETNENAGKWIRSEYHLQSFPRRFPLTDKVDAAAIAATYADGLLVISLPKKTVTEPAAQEIPVN